MVIEHAALWTRDLEASKAFFVEFFGGKPGEKYINTEANFQSYFISFDDASRLEIMQIPGVSRGSSENDQFFGYSHIAFSVGSIEKVNELTEKLRSQNYKVIREPGITGDNYYESCILDADNNRIEITV